MNGKILSLLLVVAVLPVGNAEVSNQETEYVAGAGLLTLACGPDAHPILPQGDPTEHQSPVGWLLSGEPECAGGDIQNDLREAQGQDRMAHGYGGAGHMYTSADAGMVASAWVDDQVFGSEAGYLRLTAWGEMYGEPIIETAEGCGLQSILLPPQQPHWQPEPSTEHFWWADVHAVGVEDDLDVCFATTGTLHATWGA